MSLLMLLVKTKMEFVSDLLVCLDNLRLGTNFSEGHFDSILGQLKSGKYKGEEIQICYYRKGTVEKLREDEIFINLGFSEEYPKVYSPGIEHVMKEAICLRKDKGFGEETEPAVECHSQE